MSPRRARAQWRTVPGFDAYEVSDRGRVRRAKRGLNGAPLKVLNPWKGPGGAAYVSLRRDNAKFVRAVRELQVTAFLDEASS